MATDTQTNSLIINRLTKAQYDAIETKSNTELYLIPDDIDSVPTYQSENVVSSGGVYGAIQSKAEDSQVVKLSGNQTVAGTKTFSSEVKMTSGGTSDICSGVACAFKANRAQVTSFITHDIYTGGTDSTTPITFYKYTAVASSAPSTTVQLAKIDTDGNIYEGTTKLSEKYLTSHQDITGKQDTLVSGTNIKTINNESILGSGNISISGDVNVIETVKVNGSALTPDANKAVDITVPTDTTVTNWGFTKNTGTVTGVKMNGTTNNPTSGVVDLGTVITSETSLSKGTTTGSGNAVTDISVSGHQITLTKGSTFLTSETSLSKGSDSGNGNVVTDLSVSGHQITLTKGQTVPVPTLANAGKVPVINSAGTGWDYVACSTIYSGSSAPSNSQGSNGDIYLQTS